MVRQHQSNLEKALNSSKSERLPGYQWNDLRLKILGRDNDKCVKCGRPGNEVDHILPKSLGGSDDPENLRTLCTGCHKKKTKKDNEKLRRLRKIRQFQRK